MQTLTAATPHLGPACGFLCGLVGFVAAGPSAAVLWLVVGYFLGKSMQSILWTATPP